MRVCAGSVSHLGQVSTRVKLQIANILIRTQTPWFAGNGAQVAALLAGVGQFAVERELWVPLERGGRGDVVAPHVRVEDAPAGR